MSLDVSFEVPEVLGKWVTELERAPRTVRTFIDKSVRGDLDARIQSELAPYPGPVVYAGEGGTFRFANDASRRAFFAKMRAQGLSLPYQRTNKLGEGWFSIIDLTGVTIAIGNSAVDAFGEPYANFVVGTDRQPGHDDTGWKDQTDPILNMLIDTLDIISDAWFDIIQFKGLV